MSVRGTFGRKGSVRTGSRGTRADSMPKVIGRLALCATVVYGSAMIVLTIVHFPRDVDLAPLSGESTNTHVAEIAESFYSKSYDPASDDIYIKTARKAAEIYNIKGQMSTFVHDYGLTGKRTLDVGAGSGLLQDVVADYTALDIASSARRFFHKPFVRASATAIPFEDDEFDVVWTIWVLEHVPKPELALQEMRRVVRDQGIIYLAPTWNCSPWTADGYEVRPYSDFDWAGKLMKVGVLAEQRLIPRPSYLVPIRFIRLAWWVMSRRSTTLRYNRLSPDFQRYWGPDSDAVNSIDSYETYLWFISRGDECLNCRTSGSEILSYERSPLIIRVRKPS